jgi:hypothetical protein
MQVWPPLALARAKMLEIVIANVSEAIHLAAQRRNGLLR